MMDFGLIGTILVIILIAYVLGWRPQGGQKLFENKRVNQTPREILEESYARGEINREEYE